MTTKRLALIAAALVVLPRLAAAQPQDNQARERARTFLVLRITDALKLNDEDALKVSKVIRESDERRQQLMKQRQGLEDQLRAALAKPPPDTAALSKLITAGNDIDQRLALVAEDSFHELQKVLTVEQQAKLMLFRRDLQQEIRRALQGRRGGGGRRGGRPGGAPNSPAAGDD